MANACDIEFLDTIGKHIKSPVGKEMLSKIKQKAKRVSERDGLGDMDALRRATSEVSEQYKADRTELNRRRLINMKVENDLTDFTFKVTDPTKGLLASLDGMEGLKVKGSKVSAKAMQRNWLGRLETGFSLGLQKLGILDAFKDPANYLDTFKEFFDEEGSGNAVAAKVKSVMADTYEVGRQYANQFGAAVGKLPEFMGHQLHNGEKMMKLSDNWIENRKLSKQVKSISGKGQPFVLAMRDAAFEKWKNYILPRLDKERSLDGDIQDKGLRDVFDNIIMGRYDPKIGGKFDGDVLYQGPSNIAKKISRQRVLHFKDGQSAFEYNERYGHGSLPTMVARTLRSMSDNMGFMQKFGVNGNAMFDRMAKKTEREALKRGFTKKQVNRNISRARNTLAEINGSLRVPLDNMFAKIAGGARAFNAITKLGFLPVRALSDLGNKASELRANGMGFLQSSSESFLSSAKGLTAGLSEDERHLSDVLGSYFESLPQQLMNRYHAGDGFPGGMSKLVHLSYKVTGMVRFDEINRRTLGISLARDLVLRKAKSFKGLPDTLQRTLFEHGMGKEEWDLMRSPENISAPIGNKQYLTPDAARDYSKESIAKYLNKSVDELKPREIQSVKDDMELMVRSYYMNATENVAMLPGAREAAMMHFGTDPNSVPGALIRLLTQFKGFPLSFTRRKLGRVFGRVMQDGLNKQTFLSQGKVLAQMMGEVSVYGYLSMTMSSALKGQTPPDPRNPSVVFDSIMKGGGFGIYGDFLAGEWLKYNGLSSTLGGPTFGALQQITNTLGTVGRDLQNGDDPSHSIFQLAKNNMPIINLWYTKAAFDYLFLYGLQEHMSPGSLDRMQDNLKERTGQSLIFDPDKYALGT